jgi:hypothetical protein
VWFSAGAIALALVTWQNPPFLAETGFDPSWQAGLHLAAHERLQFGPDIVFTYGPLGFLSVPILYFTSTAALALSFAFLSQLALTASLLYGVRRTFSWPLAVGLVYVVTALPIAHSDVLLLLLFLWSVFALERPEGWEARALLLLGGALSAFELLVKFNVGLASVALVGVAACALPGRIKWRAVWLPLSFVVTFIAFWLAAGGSPGGIWLWLRDSFRIAGGYSQGLAGEQSGLEWQYFVAGVIVSGLAYVVWIQAAAYPPRRRVGLLLLTAIYTFLFLKQGFVHHDVWHSPAFFSAVAVAVMPFAWRGRRRWFATMLIVVAVGATLQTVGLYPNSYFNPIGSARAFFSQARTLIDSSRRQAVLAAGHERTRKQIGLDGQTIAALVGHTVHVDPYETTAIWAYGLKWRPLRVFAANLAYTTSLDGGNANQLASKGAPDRILRQNVPIRADIKSPELESPATFLAMLCWYKQVHATRRWQVLARTHDRCGPPRLIGSTRAAEGESVDVPHATSSDIVFARIHIKKTLGERLREFFAKRFTLTSIVLDGSRSYTFNPATAANPQVLRVPTPAGFSRDFGGHLDTGRFELVNVLSRSQVRVDFYAMRLMPPTGE